MRNAAYVPVTVHPSAVRSARHFKLATSLPAKASVTAKQISFFPSKTSFMTRSQSSGRPKFMMIGRPANELR